MTPEEIVKALRCCTSGPSVADCKNKCAFYKGADMSLCIPEMGRVVSDAMENDQKHLDALNDYTIQLENQKESLLAENERLKKQRDAAVEDARQGSVCRTCHYLNNGCEPLNLDAGCHKWQWRGPQEAGKGEARD